MPLSLVSTWAVVGNYYRYNLSDKYKRMGDGGGGSSHDVAEAPTVWIQHNGGRGGGVLQEGGGGQLMEVSKAIIWWAADDA